MRYQVLGTEICRSLFAYLGAALIAVLRLELRNFLFDEEIDLLRICQEVFEICYRLKLCSVLVVDLLLLQRRQSPQLHIQNCLSL
ncbi:MAG: hypothetical protein DDT27_01181 [Dehalococcoidia bacterium]|nr:hypothetical protein [Chloroflexota bacterium]